MIKHVVRLELQGVTIDLRVIENPTGGFFRRRRPNKPVPAIRLVLVGIVSPTTNNPVFADVVLPLSSDHQVGAKIIFDKHLGTKKTSAIWPELRKAMQRLVDEASVPSFA